MRPAWLGATSGQSGYSTIGQACGAAVWAFGVRSSRLGPADYGRDRQGVFVGDSRSTQLLGTVAKLRRLDAAPTGAKPTPVIGTRVHGVLGPFLCFCDTSLAGFDVGVRVVALQTMPTSRMWPEAETFADGTSTIVDAPAVARQGDPI